MIERNTIKSQDSLLDCNDGKRSSETLIQAISKLETTTKQLEKTECKLKKVEKQLDIAIWALYSLLSGKKTIKIGKSEELIETYALNKIEELNK